MKRIALLGLILIAVCSTTSAQSTIPLTDMKELARVLVENDLSGTDDFFKKRGFKAFPAVNSIQGESYHLMHRLGEKYGLEVRVNQVDDTGYYQLSIIFSSHGDFETFFSILLQTEKVKEKERIERQLVFGLENGFTLTKSESLAVVTKVFPESAFE